MVSQDLATSVRSHCHAVHKFVSSPTVNTEDLCAMHCTAPSGVSTSGPPATLKTIPLWGCSFQNSAQAAIADLHSHHGSLAVVAGRAGGLSGAIQGVDSCPCVLQAQDHLLNIIFIKFPYIRVLL